MLKIPNSKERLRKLVDLLHSQLDAALTASVVAALWDHTRKSEPQVSFEQVLGAVATGRESYISRLTHSRTTDLYLGWLIEAFVNALAILKRLDLDKIDEVRRARRSSNGLFESQLQKIHDILQRPTSGVAACVRGVFSDPVKFDIKVLSTVSSIEHRAKMTIRLLRLMRSRPIAWLFLGVRPAHLLSLGLLLIPVMYVVAAASSAGSMSAVERLAIDRSALEHIWVEPSITFPQRLSYSIRFIGDMVSVLPVVLLLSTIPLGLVRRYFVVSERAHARLKNTEDQIRALARTLRVPKGALLNIGEVNMNTKTIKIQQSTINAPVTMADSIEGSFNTVQSSQASDELKDVLATLIKQIAEIGHGWGAQESEVTRDVKALSEEVASAAPRRKWYELSVEGLKEAALAVGEVGVPVVATLKKLLSLLNSVAG